MSDPSRDTGKILVGLADGGNGKAGHYLDLALAMGNRHGLIAGATGTGKTVTLQTLAEGFSRAGVPVFAADVKGDLAGMAMAGDARPALTERAKAIGVPYAPCACPVVLWDLLGQGGSPIRATVAEMGPLLMARLLELNDTQAGVMNILFRVADEEGLLLLDLKDLRALLGYVADHASELTTKYGNVAAATVGTIQRQLLVLENQGGDRFFGEPALEIADFLQVAPDGRGTVNVLAADRLMRSPRLYATFLLWLLSELFERLPEVGDRDRPKLVFFFDEAHLLFDRAPRPLLQAVEQVVRLIRSKGVGVYFVTQNPLDVPDSVLGQLGNRVQHALRAFTPRDGKAVKAAADTFRQNPDFDAATVIKELGVGEALVSMLATDGTPNVVERCWIAPPMSRVGPLTAEERRSTIENGAIYGKYDTPVDRDSAFEMLNRRGTAAKRRPIPPPAPPTQEPTPASPPFLPPQQASVPTSGPRSSAWGRTTVPPAPGGRPWGNGSSAVTVATRSRARRRILRRLPRRHRGRARGLVERRRLLARPHDQRPARGALGHPIGIPLGRHPGGAPDHARRARRVAALNPRDARAVLCVGGAVVDRSYRLAAPLRPETSNPATGRRGFGGVARNVAENLCRLGVPVGLVSRVGDDEGGRALLGALDALGIDRRGIVSVPGAATAEYVAVLTPEGDLALGLADMAVLDALTPEALARHADLIAASAWVFADCNLPADSLCALAQRRMPGAPYRLAVDAVSVAKSARLPERLDGVDLLLLNRDEASAMAARRGRPDASPDEAAAALRDVGAGAVVVTLGPGGAWVASAEGAHHVPAVPARVVDVTGAGDALVAAALCALRDGAGLAEAVARGCRAAAHTVGSSSAVSLDLAEVLRRR